MKPIRLIITLLLVALASAAVVGCSAEEDTVEGASAGDVVDAGTVEDATAAGDASTSDPDVEDVPVEDTSVSDTSVSDTTVVEDMVEPLDAEPSDAPQTAIVRWFEPESTGLGLDFVFKGGWAGEAGRVVTVGNDGLVASRDPEGDWEVLNLGSGADLLNDVDGSDSSNLWAVGKKGALLTGSVEVLGEQKPCVEDAECASGDECSLGTCDAGTCIFEIVESPQCCGTQVVSWGFDDGTAQGFSPQNSMGGLEWHVVTARSSSPPNSLYFGDSKKTPPDFNTGEPVSGSVLSPPVTLPTVGSASLNFKVFMDAESSTSYDQLSVSVILGGSAVEVWTKAEINAARSASDMAPTASGHKWKSVWMQSAAATERLRESANPRRGRYTLASADSSISRVHPTLSVPKTMASFSGTTVAVGSSGSPNPASRSASWVMQIAFWDRSVAQMT